MTSTNNSAGAARTIISCVLLALALGPATSGAVSGPRTERAVGGVIKKAPFNRHLRSHIEQRGEQCGNSTPDPGEECDDGNTADGDGCSSSCLVEADFECTDAIPGTTGTNVVGDPGFESGTPNPVWAETSSNFDTTLCDVPICGTGGGTGPFEGAWWSWFGGIDIVVETGSVSQSVTIPATATTLEFQLEIRAVGTTGFLTVSIDDNALGTYTEADGPFVGYALQSFDITAFADGGSHLLSFDSTTDGDGAGATNFFVDAIEISDNLGGGPPTPSVCTFLGDPCKSDGLETLAGWTLFNAGALDVDWGLTNDGVCWSGNLGPPPALNVTGGTGEAACIDSDAAGSGPVDAYLCSPAFDVSALANPKVTFRYNYQIFNVAGPDDIFEVLHGSAPPTLTAITDYTTGFSTNTGAGGFGGLPGAEETVPINGDAAYVCFRYSGDFDWYAQVDEVRIRADSCAGFDSDGDGLDDNTDNCVDVFNPSQHDADSDGIGNSCDADTAEPNDCFVNFLDLGAMKGVFLTGDPDNDLTGGGPMGTEPDGTVGFLDLGAMKAAFYADYTVDNPSGVPNHCDGS